MAEPLAIISAVAAVSQVTGELVKLTTNLRHYLKVVRRAPEEVQAFVMETSSFTGLLNFFTELADNPVKDVGRREQRRREKMVSMVQNQCAYVCDKMEYLVDRFAGLAKGNMSHLESFVERIRYLLSKPDIKDLRLSVQLATTTINATSTLFLWEQATKNDTPSVSLLEQLRNLSALAKKVSTDLATHQKRHGIRYESGMPDPNNAILAASKEIQRQVAQVVKPYSRSEAAENESWGQNPRDSFGEQTSLSGPRPSPSGSGGSAADGTPRRRVNRVPLKTSTRSKGSGSHLGDHGVGASQKGVVAQPANSRGPQSPHAGFLSLPADSARNQSKWVPSRTSPEESKRTKSNEKAHDDRSTETHPIRSKPSVEHLAFEISECSLCNCSSDHCPFSEQAESAEDKALDSNVTRGLGLPSESRKASGSEEGSSHESRRSSHEEEGEGEGEEQARHSPPTTIESEEQSAPSDKGIDSVIIVGRWSRTDLGGPPSSKSSSSPSTDSPRTPDDAKNRNSTTVRPAEFNGPREEETPDSGKEVLGVDEKKRPQPRPRTEQEQEQSVHLESAHEIRQLEARDKGTKEERRRGSESAPRESHISDDGDASSGHERPSPYVPVAPFGGPGGRRRSRRPQSKTAW